MVFSSSFPEKVSMLVLITPVLKVGGWVTRIGSIPYHIAFLLPRFIQKAWLYNPLFRAISNLIIFTSADAKLKQKLIGRNVEEIKLINPKVIIEIFKEFYKRDLTFSGKNIKGPTLIIAGDKDMIAPLDTVRGLAANIQQADFKIMNGAGHIVVLEEPEAAFRVVNDWLKSRS